AGDVDRDLPASRRPAERLPEVEVGGVVGGEQPLFTFLVLRRAPAGELDTGSVGEDPQRLRRLEAVLLLEPGEGVAVAGAAEAVVAPAIGGDLERGRRFRVERAEARVGPSGLLERDRLPAPRNY